MIYCLNPDCDRPQNPANTNLCLACGTILTLKNRYVAIKVIGQGGFGRTFLAIDQSKPEQPRCVIKQFYPQIQGVDGLKKAALLFEQEALRLLELGKHDCIPELYAHSTQNRHQYLVQEWIEGRTLAEILAREGVFDEQQIRHLLNSLLQILDFIHTQKIIHRDIKPANIILRADKTLALVDFGAAKVVTPAMSKTGTIIGSPEYIAPEQLRGKAVFASDFYSLGVTCLNLLTQASPFELFSDSSDRWVWRDYLVDNSLSYSLGRIIDKMINRAIDRRYQSTQQILKDLNPNFQIVNNTIPSELLNSDSELRTPNSEAVALGGFPDLSKLPNPRGELRTPKDELEKNDIDNKILVSTTGINYTELADLLKNYQWHQANQETAKLLLQAANRKRKHELDRDDIYHLACEDLQIIDRLWREHSQDTFGFSIQAHIWQNMEQQNYQNFGTKVGWRVNQRWILMKELDFSMSAPTGHLPAMKWWYGHAIWGLKTLFLRINACFLNY